MIALSRRCRALACSLALAGLAGLALRSTPALAEGPVRFLEVGGGLYTWDGLSATLGRADGLAPGGGARGIVEAGPHTLVVLGMAGPESSKARHRREGEARLYDRSSSPPRLLHAVQFEGEPLEGLASTDLGMALILSYRPPEGPGLASRSFLHAVDLASGRLEASSEPNAPISGIAFDAGGNRVYASQKDRIQTFGIRPLVASWHLRSPGLNGPLVIVPKSGIVCAIRGSEMAIFDPALMNGRDAADRRTRSDDATAVVPLPFKPDHMALSDDGRLVLVSAPGTMVFVEPGSQAIAWPTDTVAGLQESAAVRPLAFPGAGHDMILALLPSGAVTAVRTPQPQPGRAIAPEPAGTPSKPAATPAQPSAAAANLAPAEPAPAQPAPAAPPSAPSSAPSSTQASPPSPPAAPPAHESAPAPDTAPAAAVPPPPENAAPAPAEGSPRPPAVLSGKLTGAVARVRAIVLYGPNNILKEFARVRPESDGTWTTPLPPAGAYRVMAVGDGSTPLPIKPGYLALKVEPGVGQSGLDFEVASTP